MASPDSEKSTALPSTAINGQTVARALAADLKTPVAELYDTLAKLVGSGSLPDELAVQLSKSLDAVTLTAQRAELLGKPTHTEPASAVGMLYLDDLFGNALDEHGSRFAAHGIYARSSLKPARVVARQDLLQQWIDLVIDWGMDGGKNIGFKIDMPGTPAQAMVIVRVFITPGHTALDVARAGEDTLGWLALQHATENLGMPPLQRSLEPDGWLLRVDFPAPGDIALDD